jgi:hypothetical protein
MHGRLNVCQEALERKRAGEHLHVIARHYQVSRSTIFMLWLSDLASGIPRIPHPERPQGHRRHGARLAYRR